MLCAGQSTAEAYAFVTKGLRSTYQNLSNKVKGDGAKGKKV